MIISINKKAIIGLFILVSSIVCLLFERSPFDELVGIVSMLYVLILILLGKLSKEDVITVIVLLIVILIGVYSNIFSGIERSIYSIAIDIVAKIKVIFPFLAIKYFFNEKAKICLTKILQYPAKFYIITSFLCGIISLFVNIGMSSTSERYGLLGYRFIFNFDFQFLAVSMLAILCIVESNIRKKYKYIYYFMAAISLIFTTKSSPIIFSVLFILFCFYFKKRFYISKKTYFFILIIIILLGTYQIQTYLLNENAPRYLFFYYAGVTANEYFPLGAGFATFGSDEAARDYSPLYYLYGFKYLFGMTPDDGSFLSDNFWPMAIGQFGWIGAILYLYIFIRLYQSIYINKVLTGEERAFAYAGFLQSFIHAIGAAILSNASGQIMYIILGIVLSNKKSKSLEK